LTEFQNFSEFRFCHHSEIHHGDLASFRIPEYRFIDFRVHSENSEILSNRLPLIEKSCCPLSALQSITFPGLIAVKKQPAFPLVDSRHFQ